MRSYFLKIAGRFRKVWRRRRFLSIYHDLRDFTMIPKEIYITNLELSYSYRKIQGSIVECGTWKGGMIAGISKVYDNSRQYYLFDSFEGLPPAKAIDGQSALKWQANKGGPDYFDNCFASQQDAQKAMEKAQTKSFVITKGWFHESLQKIQFSDGISLLRMDADWYDSTMLILTNLFDQVTPGGIIIIDDYYTWEGCSKAIHDFLSESKRTERIDNYKGVCFIEKKA